MLGVNFHFGAGVHLGRTTFGAKSGEQALALPLQINKERKSLIGVVLGGGVLFIRSGQSSDAGEQKVRPNLGLHPSTPTLVFRDLFI
jgi:hypothetical protein